MLYISENHKGYILFILIAADEKAVNAYFQGKGITPHRTKVIEY